MTIDHNGPDAAYPGPAPETPDAAQEHGSGLEQAGSEPKQGVGEAWSAQRPADWDPPPGSDDDQPPGEDPQVPLPADDEAPVEEEMSDVNANNSVSSEHPEPR